MSCNRLYSPPFLKKIQQCLRRQGDILVLAFEKRDGAVKLLKVLTEAKAFFSVLDVMNSYFLKTDDYIVEIGKGGTKLQPTANQLHAYLAGFRNHPTDYTVREFYRSLEEVQRGLTFYNESGLDKLNVARPIASKINDFSIKYDEFIKLYTPELAALVIIEARKLSSMLDALWTSLLFVENRFSEEGEVEAIYENNEKLLILLTSSMSLGDFGRKLVAIDKIYKELCDLANVSRSEFPLIIKKIESGSLWAELLGSKKVIDLMAAFLGSAVTYIYRNSTKEGGISSIPQKVESLDSILDLTLKLQEAGVDTSEAKENLGKAAFALSKQMNILLDGEVEVTINDKNYTVGNEVQKQLLESEKPLKLEHNEEGKE